MSIRFIATVIFVLPIVCFAASVVEVPNGDFDDFDTGNHSLTQFNGWSENGATSGNIEEFDTWLGYGAFKVSGAGDKYLYRTLNANLFEAGNTYLLSAKIKTENVSSSGVAAVRIEYSGDSGEHSSTKPITGTQEWTHIFVPFYVESTSGTFTIEAGLFSASGDAWFDDIRITRINNALSNPDFELWDSGCPLSWDETDGDASVSIDPLTGKKCISIEGDGTDEDYIFQTLDTLEEKRDYRFSAYTIDTSDSSADAFIRVNEDTTLVETVYVEDTSNDWQQLECTFATDSSSDYTFIVGSDRSASPTEDILFDRARLEQLTVSDGGFERTEFTLGDPWQKIGSASIVNPSGNNPLLKIDNNLLIGNVSQDIELMKGSMYHLSFKAEANLSASPYVDIFEESGGMDTIKLEFGETSTPINLIDYDFFFTIPPPFSTGVTPIIDSHEATLKFSTGDFGIIYIDDVSIEEVSKDPAFNTVTVVPQPQAITDLGFDTLPISDSDWSLYSTFNVNSIPGNPSVKDKWGKTVDRFQETLADEFEISLADNELFDSSWNGGKSIVVGDVSGNWIDFNELVDDLGGVSDYVMANPEGYEIFIERDLIVIAASGTAGAQYGTETLLQYLKEIPTREHEEDNEPDRYATVPCGHIYDWSDYEWRAVWMEFFDSDPYRIGGSPDADNWRIIHKYTDHAQLIRSYMDYFKFIASMKINRLYFGTDFYLLESPAPNPGVLGIYENGEGKYYTELVDYGLEEFNPSTFPSYEYQAHDYFAALFEMCRAYHIEPIPRAGGYGHIMGKGVAEHVPTMVEGAYVGEATGLEPPGPIVCESFYLNSGDQTHIMEEDFIILTDKNEYFVPYGEEEDWKYAEIVLKRKFGSLVSGMDYYLDYAPLIFDREDKYAERWGWDIDWSEFEGVPFDSNYPYRNVRIRWMPNYSGPVRAYYNHVHTFTEDYDEMRFNASPAAIEYKVFIEDKFDLIFKYLGPLEYVMNGHGELFQMSTDGRSRDYEYDGDDYEDLNKNAQLYLKSVWFNYDTIQEKNDLYNSDDPDDDIRVLIWDDPIIRSHDNLKGNPLSKHHEGQMGGGEGDISAPTESGDSAFDHLPEDIIIGSWNFSVEHLYDSGDIVGDPNIRQEALDFDVEVSDWLKYRYLQEITRGEYYEGYEAKDFDSAILRTHQRKYDAVMHLRATVGGYIGPYYADKKFGDDFQPSTWYKSTYSQFKPYDIYSGVSVGVDYYEGEELLYPDWKEYKAGGPYLPPYSGLHGRAWNFFFTEGSYYGVPWGRKGESDPGEEWNKGWRNLIAGGSGRKYPRFDEDGYELSYIPDDPLDDGRKHWDDPNNRLNAQYYLVFNGAVRKRNRFRWEEMGGEEGGTLTLPDPAWYFKDEQETGGGGKAWLDNAQFKEQESPADPIFIDAYHKNGGFEHNPGSYFWDINTNPPSIHRILSDVSYSGNHSGLLKRYGNPNPLMYARLNHDMLEWINNTANPDYQYFEYNESVRVYGYIRTKLVDCQRMSNPWQWMFSSKELDELNPYNADDNDGNVIGCNNEMMTKFCFPADDATRTDWKPQISDISVAEWGWSTGKPFVQDNPSTSSNREDVWETPKLSNFWYRPIYLFESENVRHEKKAIYE